jgi:predicted DNA-binding ribbon-helix-helix protein
MESTVIKRSILVAWHKTSVSLEDPFWNALKEIATAQGRTLSYLITSIDVERRHSNLSSCVRLFVLDFYRAQLAKQISARNALAEPRRLHLTKSA